MSDERREFAVEVVRRLREKGFVACWAGGCVRDLLMGRAPQDYDVATSATPSEVRTVFGPRKTLAVGESFGVIIVKGSPRTGHVEVATFRREGPYSDARRPDHVTFSSPEEDAKRRDFTVNGMFYDPLEERVIDYVDGQADLEARVVRAIGDPHDRMREDRLRMLRAVRFAAILDFALEPQTADAIREMREGVRQVSAERIAQELQKMLVHRRRRRSIELAADTGLLPILVPELPPLDPAAPTPEWNATLQALDDLTAPSFEIAFSIVLRTLGASAKGKRSGAGGAVDEICLRLRLSNQQRSHIVWLAENQREMDGLERAEPWEWKRFLQQPWAADLLTQQSLIRRHTGEDLDPIEFLLDLRSRLTADEINPPPLVTGESLIARGLPPGPGFRDILDRIRNAQLNGEVSTPDEALALVDRLRPSS